MITAKWDITSSCNLRCRHCSVADMYFDKKHQIHQLSSSDRLQIIDRLADGGVRNLSLLGGEPLTLGEEIWPLLQRARERNIGVHLVTNGLLLSTGTSKRLIDSGLKCLIVSIDGPSAITHNKNRGKHSFERTLENLTNFVTLRGNRSSPKLTINTVLSKFNRTVFPQMIPFCRDLGADSWNALTLNYLGNANHHLDNLALSQEEHTEVALEIGQFMKSPDFYAGNLKINLSIVCPLVWEYLCKKYKVKLPQPEICCSASSSLVYVSPKGEMHLCDRVDSSGYTGMKLDNEIMRPEDLLSNKFEDVWNSKQYTEMFTFVNSNDAYDGFEPCNRCKYFFDRSCNPCPLQAYRADEIRYEECLKAEQFLGDISCYDNGQKTDWEKAHQFASVALSSFDSDKYEKVRLSFPVLPEGLRCAVQPDNSALLVHPKTQETIKINEVGLTLLDSMDGSETTDQLVGSIVEAYLQAHKTNGTCPSADHVDAFKRDILQAFILSLYEKDFIELKSDIVQSSAANCMSRYI